MAERIFTLAEANELLPTVRSLAERMVAHRRALSAATARRAQIVTRIAGNGGGLDPRKLNALQQVLDTEAAGVVRCVEELQSLGVLVKDLDRGLVDFPTLREGQEALLCWHVGEDTIAYWHGAEEGFAGRKPL